MTGCTLTSMRDKDERASHIALFELLGHGSTEVISLGAQGRAQLANEPCNSTTRMALLASRAVKRNIAMQAAAAEGMTSSHSTYDLRAVSYHQWLTSPERLKLLERTQNYQPDFWPYQMRALLSLDDILTLPVGLLSTAVSMICDTARGPTITFLKLLVAPLRDTAIFRCSSHASVRTSEQPRTTLGAISDGDGRSPKLCQSEYYTGTCISVGGSYMLDICSRHIQPTEIRYLALHTFWRFPAPIWEYKVQISKYIGQHAWRSGKYSLRNTLSLPSATLASIKSKNHKLPLQALIPAGTLLPCDNRLARRIIINAQIRLP